MKQDKQLQRQTFPPVDFETWKQEAEKTLKGKSVEQLYTDTYEQIRLKPVYTKADVEHLSLQDELPGFGSYTRGSSKLGYISSPWLVSQEIDATTPKEFNEIIKNAIKNGQTMIHFVREQSKETWLKTIEDVKVAFEGISLSKIPLMIDNQESSESLRTVLISFCKDTNVELHTLTGTIGADPLGTLSTAGVLKSSLSELYDDMSESIHWSKSNAPNLRTILVKGHPYHNGGATAVQELAFTLATATEYLYECIDRGNTADDIASKMTFSFSIGSNLFMEIAKLRAARKLWSTIIEQFRGSKEAARMNIHARTSELTKTKYDPYVNILRSTTEAFAAAVGGVDSLHVSTFDVALKQSDDFSRRIARNTQLILQEEAHLDKVIDPAGGSWYVEALTNEVAEKAWELFKEVDEKGGMLESLKSGFVQEKIRRAFEVRQNNIHVRKDKIVGTNVYANLSEKAFATSNEKVIYDSPLKELMIEKIPQNRLSQSFEELRSASESYKESTGEWPTIGLINLGPIPEHKTRADFITGFFEAGGFSVKKNDGYVSVEEAIKGSLESNLQTYVFCGTDNSYKLMVKNIACELRKLNPSVRLFIAGKQENSVAEDFIKQGISDFIHIKSDCFTTLRNLQLEMGVQTNG